MSEARFADLESRLAFADDAINQLSEVVRAQADHIDRIEARLKRLQERMEDLQHRGGGGESAPANDPPPHW